MQILLIGQVVGLVKLGTASLPEEVDIPEEFKRREARLAQTAKDEIEARARQRFEQQTEYEAKLARRHENQEYTGNKPGGRPPAPPCAEPKDKDQVNLTDEDPRIMPSRDGFVQSYNAQAAVGEETT